MTTLAAISRQVARLLVETVEGEATAGTTTTLTDTVNLKQPANKWTGGILWILSGDNDGSVISPSKFSENKITWETALAAVIAIGDDYEIADADYSYMTIKKGINQALLDIGLVEQTPDESLETVSGQTSYTIPSGVSNIQEVWVVTDLGEDTEWKYQSTHWDEEDGEIVFDQGYTPSDDLTLRLVWTGKATPLSAVTDTIPATIDEDYLTWVAARFVLRQGVQRYGKDRKEVAEWLNEAIESADGKKKRNRNKPAFRIHTA